MRRLGVLCTAAVLLVGDASAATTRAKPPRRLDSPPAAGRTLGSVVLADHTLLALTDDERAARLAAAGGATLVSRALRIWRAPGPAAVGLIARLERLGALRYAEPDLPVEPLAHLPGDRLAAPELGYHLYRIGADRAEPPGPGFPLTVVDTGLDLTHPEFRARPDTFPLNPQDVSDPTDAEDYHGTVVSSTAAAPLDGIGAVGVYPQAVLRVYDLGRGTFSSAAVVAGIEAALAAGQSVINLSLGGPEPSRAVYEATLRAFGSGSLVVAAAGNEFDRGNPVLYPAAFPHVLTVAATDRNDQPSSFSSASFAVDLAAPGEDIPSQDPRDPNAHFSESGTSFSSPMVAAAAAWVRTARPALDTTQVFELLRQSARDVGPPGFDERTGFGMLDIPSALTETPPVRDLQEPNDDVDQIVAGGVFRQAKAAIRGRFSARLDTTEDPSDLYRLVVPARRTAVVGVTANGNVALALLSGRIRSLTQGIGRNRLRFSNRAGRQSEQITYANRSGGAVTAFVHVSIASRSATGNPDYRLTVTIRRS